MLPLGTKMPLPMRLRSAYEKLLYNFTDIIITIL